MEYSAIERIINQKIAILGYGVNNRALTAWLLHHGAKNITICDHDATVRDEKPAVKWRLGKNYLNQIDEFDIVFRTPGLPYLHPQIQSAKKRGVEISSQTKLFFELCPAKIIGVTGTKGKGTTASLILAIMQSAKSQNPDSKIYLGGNIGKDPFEFIDDLTVDDWVVIELSSFQLQDLHKSPHLAVVLPVSSDHLDYHRSADEYRAAKYQIVEHQRKTDFAVISADFINAVEFASRTIGQVWWFSTRKRVEPGVYVKKTQNSKLKTQSYNSKFEGEFVVVDDQGREQSVISTNQVQLIGEHNWQNIAAAMVASFVASASVASIRATIRDFKGLLHRLEKVAEINGAVYYNDSYATNPDATIAALKTFDRPVILLAGGSDKGADYSQLGGVAAKHCRLVISFGETGQRINQAVLDQAPALPVEKVKNLREAVKLAKATAQPGEVVLLSPASASFDQFRSATERGEVFKTLVHQFTTDAFSETLRE